MRIQMGNQSKAQLLTPLCNLVVQEHEHPLCLFDQQAGLFLGAVRQPLRIGPECLRPGSVMNEAPPVSAAHKEFMTQCRPRDPVGRNPPLHDNPDFPQEGAEQGFHGSETYCPVRNEV